MEKDQKQQHYNKNEHNNNVYITPFLLGGNETEEIVPGVPIIRSNTPRPRSFDAMISSHGYIQKPQPEELPREFPAKAPSAPPLPEELEEDVDTRGGAVDANVVPPPPIGEQTTSSNDEKLNEISGLTFADVLSRTGATQGGPISTAEQTNFAWLFEYGLEMDASILNSRERLNGHAYLQGPALLKGYKLMLGAQRIHNSSGPTIVALAPAIDTEAEIWGVLYRIPRRLMDSSEGEPSLLDTIHAAITPQKFFEEVEVVVYDIHQNREVRSITYTATNVARQQLQLVEPDQWDGDSQFMQRLVEIARQQKLPEDYIRRYLMPEATTTGRIAQVRREDVVGGYATSMPSLSGMYPSPLLPSPLPLTNPGQDFTSAQKKQNTDSLPVFKDDLVSSTHMSQSRHSQRWMITFSLYLVGLLLMVLLLAVIQGTGIMGGGVADDFTPLGVPWQVIIYGLLGGCISCIVSLSNLRTYDPPLFVMITWFTRPFVGSILAIFSYILLTSGLFMLGGSVARHPGFFWLAGTFAGLCEWWLFCRHKS